MNNDVYQQWLHWVFQKQSLGQQVGDEELEHFKTTWDIAEEEFLLLKNKWDNLIQHTFLPLNLYDRLLEVQGHSPTHFDLLLSDEKKILNPQLEKMEWDIWLQSLCINAKVDWNNAHPFVSFAANINHRPCRISLQHYSLSAHSSSKIFIRFHCQNQLSIHHFLDQQDFSLIEKLQRYINENKYNILICGQTGSGKTTLLRTLSESITEEEHVICIEDTAELHLNRARTTTLLAQAHHHDFEKSVSMDQLCTYAMRMTPDRLIMGEIRGKEIISLSLLLNTGHQGLLSTVHASNAQDALYRLALLFCLYQKDGQSFNLSSVLKFLCKQFQKIIFVKNKKIQQLISVVGCDEGNIFFETEFEVNCEER